MLLPRGGGLNAWLLRNGYLALENGASESGKYFENVDWSLYPRLHVRARRVVPELPGRESNGAVAPGEAEALKRELIEELTGLRDSGTGEVAIQSLYAASALYKGPYLDAAPDLIVGYADGYRTSWDAAIGRIGPNVFEDNDKAWSGDHCVDPLLVPGVLFRTGAWTRTIRESRIWPRRRFGFLVFHRRRGWKAIRIPVRMNQAAPQQRPRFRKIRW